MANLLSTNVSGRLYASGYVDTNVNGAAFRFYDGTTFRGGLGLDDWAHSGSAADITMYVAGAGTFYITTNSIKRHWFNAGEVAFRTYAPDLNYKTSFIGGDQLNTYYGSGSATLYVQYHNGSGGNFNVGAGKLTVDTAGTVIASGSLRAPIFYDSNDTTYYLDPNSSTSGYFAGTLRQNVGKYVRDSYYRTISGYGDYYSGGNAGWTRVAEIRLTSNCSGAVLYGTLYDHRYDGADAYQISIVARAECNFTSDNESHYINVGCTITGSTAYSNYRDKIRVLLIESSAGSRKYEVQFYETNWNHNTWQLESNGWTVLSSAEAPGASVGGERVNYISNQNADNVRANSAVYSPIYYDSNNTSYYLDPNSITSIRTVGSWRADASAWDGEFSGKMQYHSNHWYIQAADLFIYRNAGGSNVFTINQSGDAQANSSMRAPIFYDSNDTGYYLDPNGTSNLLQLNTATRARWGMPRWWNDRSSFISDQGYWTGTNGWTTGQGTWANAWKGGFSGWDIWGTSTDHPQGAGTIHAQGIVSGQHYASSDGGEAYGWMMVGAHAATENRYWLRGKWGTNTSGWVEMITTGNIASQSVSYADESGYSASSGSVEWTSVQNKPATFPPSSHNHDDRYYTETESDGRYLYYRGINASNDFQTYQSSPGIIRFDQVNDINTHSNPPGGYTYGGVLSMRGGNFGFQLWGSHTGDFYFKTQWNDDQYSGWRYVVHSGNIGSQSVNYATTAGNTNSISNSTGNTHTWTGANYFRTNNGGYLGSLSSAPLQVYSDSNNSAYMSFHKGGYYAVNLGLDADNVMRIGGWSAASNRWELDMSGNNTVAGSFRAPIFYDSADTAYYVDPNSTSNLAASYIGRVLINYDGTDTWFRMQSGNRMRITTTGGTDFIIPNTGEMTYNGNTVIHTGNIGSQSVNYAASAGDASTLGGFGRGNTTNKVAYFDGTRNLYVNNPESYTGEVRLGAAWNRGGVYASSTLSMATSGGAIDFVSNDTTIGAFRWDSTNGSRFIVGENVTTTPYTLIDSNKRPVIYQRGQYPVLTLDHTVTSNGVHGPTIQFVHNGYQGNQWVIGTNGPGTRLDIGFSNTAEFGNTSYNPHNGIGGYNGKTLVRMTSAGVAIGSLGTYPTVIEPAYTLDVRGNSYSSGNLKVDGFVNVNGATEHTVNDNGSVVHGTTTNNRVFINGSIQLTNNNDAIVIGRGTSTFLTDEEIGFGWGGGWYMTEGSYIRSRGSKSLHMNGGSVDYVGSMYLEGSGTYAHLQPNSGSYGSLQITNSKGSWSGIRFTASNVNIMANPSESGFHNNDNGWQILWSGGTLYVGKGGYGGSNATVWDSSNAPRANYDNLMYYQGFTLDANSMASNSTGFTYANNAPHVGPIVRFSTGGSYDLWLNSDYWGGNDLYFRTRNGDTASLNSWKRTLNATTDAYAAGMNQYVRTTDDVTHNSTTSPTFLVNNHSDNTKGYRIHTTSGASVSAMFTNSSNYLVIGAGAFGRINLNKDVHVNGVSLGVGSAAPSGTAGRIDASNDIVAYSSSDERLKHNITPIENAIDKVKSLTGVEFDWKPEYKHAHGYEGHDTGIIAQQVQEVIPSAVRTNDTGFLAVRYEKLIGLLVEGMKEQQAQIEELKAKLDGLTK